MIPKKLAPTTTITLPAIPALCVNAQKAAILSAEGEIKTLPLDQARLTLHKKQILVCHAPQVRAKLGLNEFQAFDVLELFAFVHPNTFTIPTPQGLSKTLGLNTPEDFEDMPIALTDITRALLSDLRNDVLAAKADPLEIARVMGLNGKGWEWTPFIFAARGETYDPDEAINGKTTLNIWKKLPEWAEDAPEPPPSHHGVSGEEVQKKLAALLGRDAEERPEQAAYAKTLAKAFVPRGDDEKITTILAEAGTGVGKTLGYLAPAGLWAEKNQGTVWISTYTKNLQRQIDQELDKLYPNPDLKRAHVAIRKGRENYLCLLNLEDLAAGAALARTPKQAVAAGIMARWAAGTKDGDLGGEDFPAWLARIVGYPHTLGLADRRGECLYTACDHYRKCFVEHSVRKAKRARVVVSNHALTMISSALAGPQDDMPSRMIFDEGHHLFDAADSAFAAHLSAQETRDLRRWVLGAEGGRRRRARGLSRRAEGLIAGDPVMERCLQDALMATHALTGDGWTQRLKNGAPIGPCENFLMGIYKQVHARASGRNGPYSLETEIRPLEPAIADAAEKLKIALQDLQRPLQKLAKLCRKKLKDDPGDLDSDTRKRLDALAGSLERRTEMTLAPWMEMLEDLSTGDSYFSAKSNCPRTRPFIDWFEIERIDGRAVNIGMYRHFIDPMLPFAASVKPHLHGIAITSATLKDSTENEAENWRVATQRTGAEYLSSAAPVRESYSSPFDYAAQTKIFILNDVRKEDIDQVAGAYQALFQASGGGALGIFTAIARLRAVRERIAAPLEQAGLALYSQHIDEMDSGTLVDMFREDTHACLLGTDAVRDGVDVPGESLRLIVFERTPWPRPTILHKARRKAFGGRHYDDMITRLKLKQAFGRLIRRAGDKGVFVMLDAGLPSRLRGAFPPGVEIETIGLAEAAQKIRAFLCE